MEFFDNLAIGFGVALTPANLGFAFIGAMVGTLIGGDAPGLGLIATIAISCCPSPLVCDRSRHSSCGPGIY